MKLTHSKTILLPDDDQFDAVLDFYHRVLGLLPLGTLNPSWVEFDTGSCRICLHQNNRYQEPDHADPKRHHIVLSAPGETVIRKHDDLQKLGYIPSKEPFPTEEYKLGKLVQKENSDVFFFLKDPMGNIVQIESNRKST